MKKIRLSEKNVDVLKILEEVMSPKYSAPIFSQSRDSRSILIQLFPESSWPKKLAYNPHDEHIYYLYAFDMGINFIPRVSTRSAEGPIDFEPDLYNETLIRGHQSFDYVMPSCLRDNNNLKNGNRLISMSLINYWGKCRGNGPEYTISEFVDDKMVISPLPDFVPKKFQDEALASTRISLPLIITNVSEGSKQAKPDNR